MTMGGPAMRTQTLTQKVKTCFGSMYIHIEIDDTGQPVGGSISDPGKQPTSPISELVKALSQGLNEVWAPSPDGP
jgi:hypothetical protein